MPPHVGEGRDKYEVEGTCVLINLQMKKETEFEVVDCQCGGAFVTWK